jgi:hypothetical protein
MSRLLLIPLCRFLLFLCDATSEEIAAIAGAGCPDASREMPLSLLGAGDCKVFSPY